MLGPDVREHIASMEGQTLPTLKGRPNRILNVSGNHVVIGTVRNPEGARVSYRYLQDEVDRLWSEGGEAKIDSHGRGAVVGAVLKSMGFEVLANPRRVVVPDAWMRDELILALDLYLREGRSPSQESVEVLSDLLRSIEVERHLADEPKFRNPAAIRLQIANFVSIDPEAETSGTARGGREDQEVWDEFARDQARVARVAKAIRSEIANPDAETNLSPEPEVEEAAEGRILTRVHRSRERSRKLVEQKKRAILRESGHLDCECCGFNFESMYGNRGDGFIECHHKLPLSEASPDRKTKVSDLALVCANCHRMIHARRPWLSIEEVKELIEDAEVST